MNTTTWTTTGLGAALLLTAANASAYDCTATYGGNGPATGPNETGVECEQYADTNGNLWERRASYWIPSANPGTGSYPVVFAFHGGNQGEWDCANNMDLNTLYDAFGREFILVCPRPMQMLSGTKGWVKHFGKHGSHAPELHAMDNTFIADFIQRFTNGTTFNGDPNRVYTIGFSGAGAFLHGFAAHNSNLLAGSMMMSAPVAGLQNDGIDDPINGILPIGTAGNATACDADPACEPLDVANSIYPDDVNTVGAVPVLLIHSWDDGVKPYHGGNGYSCAGYTNANACNIARRARTSFASNFLYPGALSTTGWWLQNNGCNAGQFTYNEYQWTPPGGTPTTDYNQYTFNTNCTEVRSATLYAGWGHTYQNGTLGNYDTNQQTLDFFDTLAGGLGWMP